MLLPLRSKNPPERFPIGTLCLIGINLLVFALTVDDTLHVRAEVLRTAGISLANFNPFSLIAHLFVHANLLHLAGNMWFLYLFGFAAEGRLRTPRFLVVYFAAGFAGSLLHQAMFGQVNADSFSYGASGAIMGVMGGALFMFPFSKVDCFFAWYY